MVAKSLWCFGSIPVRFCGPCGRGDGDVRADEECGVDKARARALLDQERGRLEQLGRAVARDHDDAVAASRP